MKAGFLVMMLFFSIQAWSFDKTPTCRLIEKRAKEEVKDTNKWLEAHKNVSFKIAKSVTAIFGYDRLAKLEKTSLEAKRNCDQEIRDFIEREYNKLDDEINRIILESEMLKLKFKIEEIANGERFDDEEEGTKVFTFDLSTEGEAATGE